MAGLFERVGLRRPAWLKRWERPAHEHPAPRVALVSLAVGGLLLVIGSLLPWSDTAIPVVETINGQEVVTDVRRVTPRGVSEGGVGGVTLGLGIVIVGIASLLWQQGLRDAVGIGLPFLAALAVVIAGLKYGDVSSAVSQIRAINIELEGAGESELLRIQSSVGSGLYLTLVGGILASLGALRVSLATRKAGKEKRPAEERAGRGRSRGGVEPPWVLATT